ncbi:hypothetical protein B0T10DRAFT_463994 [Thelonectria olida]|uniref:Uncharacterized protein n=1 Tax=Thelonectria olida TaxID=1576542 RepID=A0A9P9AL65_9HYPO|nr:hypothetical protein B0T10DRAFT_463994 [Thelonectria olida]
MELQYLNLTGTLINVAASLTNLFIGPERFRFILWAILRLCINLLVHTLNLIWGTQHPTLPPTPPQTTFERRLAAMENTIRTQEARIQALEQQLRELPNPEGNQDEQGPQGN